MRPAISIVVLNYKPERLEAFWANVAATIGADFERVELDNQHGRYASIATAYNDGARRANCDYVAFVHDDVAFRSQGWGARAIEHMRSDPGFGLLGVIGTKFKSYQATSHTNRIQGDRFRRGSLNAWRGKEHTARPVPAEEVVCVDGLFLFMPRSVFKRVAFDEGIVKGFHGYDLDISLQVHFSGLKVVVAPDIHMDHFSPGKHDMSWLETNRAISRKWSRSLPTASSDLQLRPWQLAVLELRTIIWLAGPNHLKNLVKVPLGFLRFAFRPPDPPVAMSRSALVRNEPSSPILSD